MGNALVLLLESPEGVLWAGRGVRRQESAPQRSQEQKVLLQQPRAGQGEPGRGGGCRLVSRQDPTLY